MTAADLFSLHGRTALITGGSRGIGFAIARALSSAGARVYVSARSADECASAVEQLGGAGSAAAIPADLSNTAGVKALVAELGARESSLSILVNNAGTAWGAPLDDFPVDGWDKVMALNVRAVFFLTQACLPLLRAAASADDPARVLNVGSMVGIRPPAMDTYAYSVSKAAVHHLTRVLAKRLAREHVTVNAIAPGPFETRMMEATLRTDADAFRADVPLGRFGRDTDLAGASLFLCGLGGSYVTGHVLPLDGGQAAL